MKPRYLLLLTFALSTLGCSVDGVTVRLGGGRPPVANDSGGSASAGAQGFGGLSLGPEPTTACPSGMETSVSGTVYDPAGRVPLYNAVVYVPSVAGELPPFPSGVACEKCTDPVPAKLAALSGPDGHFVLRGVPSGEVELVVQLGKWRRKQTVSVKACQDNPLTDPDLTRLPRTKQEGDIPKIALSTGHSDALECLLRKVGIADQEFTTDVGAGRVNLFVGCEGDQADKHFGANQFAESLGGSSFPSTSQLFEPGNIDRYDVVIFSCEGHKCDVLQTEKNIATLVDFANRGGRVFLDHNHYNWLNHANAPIESAAQFSSSSDEIESPLATVINTGFPKGEAFAAWLLNVGASSELGALDIYTARTSVQSLSPNRAQSWIFRDELPAAGFFYFTIGTPVAEKDDDPAPEACGRVVFTDLHVSKSGGGDSIDFSDQDTPFPGGCTTLELSAQEKALEFMLFDLTSCVQQETDKPTAPPPK
ncbi:MAG TPA: carboxypeptidase-like regulatory domain-containing protein [Polyangiaceae bacterium]